jgi:hypothetical protein
MIKVADGIDIFPDAFMVEIIIADMVRKNSVQSFTDETFFPSYHLTALLKGI